MAEKLKKLMAWLDRRFPLLEFWNNHVAKYFAPKNFNFWYLFGVFSTIVLINQIITGVWLTMYYTPTESKAFSSVEYIMRYVHFGWLFRYLHSTGASAFFLVVYLHMYRGIMYGSFKTPRELIWLIGVMIYIFLIFEAVSGYVLPWGQMSYWAIKVLVSIFSVIPLIGKQIVMLLQGDYNVSGVTLHRFFAFHVGLFPMIIVLLTFLHLTALHRVGSNNPDGIEVNQDKQPKQTVTFFPYYVIKDFLGVVVFTIVFTVIVLYVPTFHGLLLEPDNFAPANPLVTPENIAPPWYLAPFYSILRAVPNKAIGVTLAVSAIALLSVLPWLDRSTVRSIRYRGMGTKIFLSVFVISFIGLGALGITHLTPTVLIFSRIFVLGYFSFFIAMPFYTRYEKTKPLPELLTS